MYKSSFYRCVLYNEIHNNNIKELRKELTTSVEILSLIRTLFKSIIIRIFINRSKSKYEKKIMKHYQNKLQNDEKNKENKIQANPNLEFIKNSSSHVLTNEEHSMLQFGLKLGLSTPPNQGSIRAYAEDIWEQIDRAGFCRYEMYYKLMMKSSLRGMV